MAGFEDLYLFADISNADLLVEELVQGEITYLKSLQSLKYGIMQPLQEKIEYGKPIITKDEYASLFPKAIETLLSLAQVMLISFSRAQESNRVESLGNVFLKQADYFKCYRNYIADLPARLQVLYKLKHARAVFRQFLEAHFPRRVYHELDTILAMPEAVIPRYVHIVNQLVTEFPDSSGLRGALNKLTELQTAVGGTNRIAAEVEQRKLVAIQNQLRGRVNIVAPDRKQILNSCYYAIERDPKIHTLIRPEGDPAPRYLTVFNDALLIAIPYRSGEAVLERFLPITHVTASAYLDEPFDNILALAVFGHTYYLATPSQDERDMWVNGIQDIKKALEAPLFTLHEPVGVAPISSPNRSPPSLSPRVEQQHSPLSSGQVKRTTPPTPKEPAKKITLPVEKTPPPDANNGQTNQTENAHASLSPRKDESPRSAHATNSLAAIVEHPLTQSMAGSLNNIMMFNNSTHLVIEVVARKDGEEWRELGSLEAIPFFVGVSGALIGRQLDAEDARGQILIMDDSLMSRTHGELKYDFKERTFSLRDLGSSNNTVIVSGFLIKQGQRINIENKAIGMGHGKASPWFRLALNFVFQLGGTRFKVINLHIVEDADTKDPFAKTKQSGLSFGDFAGAWSPETETETLKKRMTETFVADDQADHIAAVFKTNTEPKKIPIYIKNDDGLRGCGALLLKPGQRFQDLQRAIFLNLLTPEEQLLCGKESELFLFVNGRRPIRSNQLSENAFASLEHTDQVVASIGPL